ncbi:MAG TPA: hypothetical protein P5024_12585 [Burkholderiaceae bacterium]|nr:hypothetical protein [Burkholderiaceae bacterium]
MAAYPFTTFHQDSTPTPASGREVARATNGALRVRDLYSADKTRFELVHRLTQAERNTLLSFYTTNKDLDLDLTWDGTVYTCRFAGRPQILWRPGNWYEARVVLEQV